MPIYYGPSTSETSLLNRLLWDTDVDWNKGTLGTDVEVVNSGASAQIAPKTTIRSGPDIYLTWRFNETEGTIAADSSQYNRPGTLVTFEGYNPAQWVAGKLNNAISQPGEYESNDSVEGGDIAGFEWNEPFSIECWFNQSPGYDVIITGNYNSTEVKGWHLGIQEGYLRMSLVGGSENFIQTFSTSIVTTNTYQHLVVTYDGTGLAAGIKFYLDGLLLTNSVYSDTLAEVSIVPTANIFHVGAIPTIGGWTGQLDEFNLYTVILSQANVDFRYNAGAGTETPVFTQPIYPTTAHYETNPADSKIAGQLWGAFNFMRTTPAGTTVVVKVRVADDANAMGSYGSSLVAGADIGLAGQFIQFSVDFTGTITERVLVDYISALYVAIPVHSVLP